MAKTKQTSNGEKSMRISVANPIYDSVFKFLMEDERIAKIVLSALLKKEVLSVEMRRHEHPNVTHDKITMFRIDFAAKVREDDGTERLILIELQKTWLETETLRFRHYLAAQYNAEENMVKEGANKGFALPMVAVYLLGHRVGEIDEPVVYVNHKATNYDGKVVEHGDSDPFITSLTHNSIIVQIPLLHGKVNNRLDKVLSVFDQSQCAKNTQQLVCLDSEEYEDDRDMMYILHRLSLAAMDADLRQEMNEEDEFFSVIAARDSQVMEMNKVISEKQAQINEQTAQINEQTARINEQTAQINEQTARMRSMAQVMLKNGVAIAMVAQLMDKTIDEVKDLLKD